MPAQPHRHSDTADRHTTKDRRAAGNSGFAKWRVQYFYESFVQGSTFGILMNICAENSPLRKAPKRYGQVQKTRRSAKANGLTTQSDKKEK